MKKKIIAASVNPSQIKRSVGNSGDKYSKPYYVRPTKHGNEFFCVYNYTQGIIELAYGSYTEGFPSDLSVINIAVAYSELPQEEWDSNPQRATDAYCYTCKNKMDIYQYSNSYGIAEDLPESEWPKVEYIKFSSDLKGKDSYQDVIKQDDLDYTYKKIKAYTKEIRSQLRQLISQCEEHYENSDLGLLEQDNLYLFNCKEKLRKALKFKDTKVRF